MERKNRTDKEIARTMLNEYNLLDIYCKEAVHTIVYTLNRVKLRVNSRMNPYELWYDKKPSVKYFKVFGSKCFIRRDEDGLGIFESKCDEGIFLGYSTHNKEYKCFNKHIKKVVEIVHVRVDEDMQKGKQNVIHPFEEPCYKEDEENEEEVTKKPPSNYVQKYHPNNHIIGSKDGGVQTRRKHATNNEQVIFFLLTEMEQKNYIETSKNEK